MNAILAILFTTQLLEITLPPIPELSPTYNIALYAHNSRSKHPKPVALYLGFIIEKEAAKRQLDPYLLAAIISVESDFRFIEVNHTGDYGLTQINYRVWRREYARLRLGTLNKEKLIGNPQYSIEVAATILSLMKERHKESDSLWYARYHSSTPYFKNRYAKKVKKRLTIISNYINM